MITGGTVPPNDDLYIAHAPPYKSPLVMLVERTLKPIIAVNRNLGFFTTGYHTMIQIIPALVVAPIFIRGDVEYSALQMLVERERRASERGDTVWLVGMNPGVLEVVRKSGLAERLGRDRMLFNARAAIARYQEMQEAAGKIAPPVAS